MYAHACRFETFLPPRRVLAWALGACLLALAGLTAGPVEASQRPWPKGAPWPPPAPPFPLTRPLTPPPAPDSVAEAPRAWTPGDDGWLLAPAPEDSVVLRLAPFSTDSLALEAGRLPSDAHVLVLDVRSLGWGIWVQVRPTLADEPTGWVHAKQLGREPRWTYEADAPPEEFPPADDSWLVDTRSPRERARDARFGERYGVAIAGGAAATSGGDLADEYEAGGYTIEVEAVDFGRGVFVLAAGLGYQRFGGAPTGEYAFADHIAVPERSSLGLGFALFEVGVRKAWREGLRVGFMAGPVMALVHEEADLRLYTPDTRLPLGESSSALDRFTAGGGATAWVSVATPAPVEVGLRVRAFALGWRGREELPLASDWAHDGFAQADLALVVTFASH